MLNKFSNKKTSDSYQAYEGGGLTADSLKKLNKGNRINDSDQEDDRKSKASVETQIHGLKLFDKYGPLFADLTKRTFIDTHLDVISIVISYDSKFCVAIVNNKDEHFELQGISLLTFEPAWKIVYKGTYIKMNLVEQNDAGTIFAVAYQDNGMFRVSVVTNKGEEIDNLDVNTLLALDDLSKPITGFWEPLITVAFIPGDNLFISAYHRKQKKQFHFTYSY